MRTIFMIRIHTRCSFAIMLRRQWSLMARICLRKKPRSAVQKCAVYFLDQLVLKYALSFQNKRRNELRSQNRSKGLALFEKGNCELFFIMFSWIFIKFERHSCMRHGALRSLSRSRAMLPTLHFHQLYFLYHLHQLCCLFNNCHEFYILADCSFDLFFYYY